MQDPLQQLREDLRQFARERDWEQFHSPKNLAAALSVEAGEVLEHFQWLSERESVELPAEKKQEIALELADVLLYLVRLADQLDLDLTHAARDKLELNRAKYPADVVKGSHKKYSDY